MRRSFYTRFRLFIMFMIILSGIFFRVIYVKADTITVTTSQSSSTDSFPTTISYNGATLYKSGSSYVSSGTYTPADSKFITGYTPESILKTDVAMWNGTGFAVVDTNPHVNAAYKSYNSGGYSGTLSRINTYDDPGVYVYPGSIGLTVGGIYDYYRYLCHYDYEGTVTKPAVDTRVYTQQYSGTMTIPASDTRVWTQNYSGSVTTNRDAGLQMLDSSKSAVSSINMLVGATWTGYVRVTNTGSYTWTSGANYKLGTDSTTFPGQPSRYTLNSSVAPGGYYDFPVTLTATSVGIFNLHYQMAQSTTWFGDILNVPVNVIKPEPIISNTLKVVNYDYKESDTAYWVKPNSTIGVYSDGYFPSSYGVYPTRNYVLFAKDGNYNSATSGRQYTDTTQSYWNGTEYPTYFNFINNSGDKAVQSVSNGNNVLSSTNHLTAKTDGTSFKLYHTTTYINNGTEYYSSYLDSGIWLKVDGKAPATDNIAITKQVVDELDLKLTNLKDEGSGVDFNNLYMEVQPIDYSGNLIGVKEKSYNYSSLGGSDYNLKIDWNNSQNKDWYGKFKVQVYTKDNVGNEAYIYSAILDRQLLAIKGVITPNPARQGQNTSIIIQTEGSANKIKVVFPDELAKLATEEDPLVIEKDIKIEPIHNEQLNARVPLEAPVTLDELGNRLRAPYKIYIEAVNGYGDKVSDYLYLDVQGNILDDLKVRLRSSGYDKE